MPTEEIFMPTDDREQTQALYRMLALGRPKLVGPHGEEMELPAEAFRVLKEVVRNMQMGRVISLVPQSEEFTTQGAANFLGCSRPHLVKLLEAGQIPFHKTGMHRRIRYKDLVAYARDRDARRRAVLDTLARESVSQGSYEGTAVSEGDSDE